MTRRARALVVVVVVAALGTAAIYQAYRDRQSVDLSRDPQTVFATIAFEVGATYTLGSMAIPSDVTRPVTVVDVVVVKMKGVQVLGRGLFDLASNAGGIGLIPGWPPPALDLVDPANGQVAWPGEVALVIGLRTLEPKSGLRGVLVRWVDGDGEDGERVFDLAVLTCAPGACEVDAAAPGPLLKELGLRQ